MRRMRAFGLSPRVAGGTLVLLICAGAAPAQGIAKDLSAPPQDVTQAGAPWMCEAPAFGAGPGPAFDPAAARLIAGVLLSAQETALGIRPDQIGAWRGYTAALIALMPSGERLGRWRDEAKRADAQAFDLAQDIAGAAIERAEKARALQDAVSKLKAVLTPDQMAMARLMQERLIARIVYFVEWRRGRGGGPL